jgi:subtilisin family serine protease
MNAVRTVLFAGAALALAACSDQTPTAARGGTAGTPSAPVVTAPGNGISGKYIVVLKPGVGPRTLLADGDVQPEHVYTSVLNGFSAELNQGQLNALQHNPNVEYIEQDGVASIATTQSGATWGLDRIDQRNRPLSGTYTYTTTASNVTAYIIDTGLQASHPQFGGRASMVYGSADCNGHGTHVAGTIGSSTYGVAKGVKLRGVRVLDCAGSGAYSTIIAGIDWVAQPRLLPAVANMSLGGGASQAVDDAVARLTNAGVVLAVAAGNENQNACNTSPARAASAITVGATTNTDARASFSNYGSCLDVFAPGNNITSAWYRSTTATNTIRGTSMASPHVAGVAALYLQGSPSASVATVTSAITSTATTGVVTSAGTGSPNRLLYSLLSGTGGGGGGGGTAPCTGCTLFTGSVTSGGSSYQPNNTYYQSTVSGTHQGWLQGPTGADFDLYLYKWNGSSWVVVASGTTSSNNETVSYSGTAGYYEWEVRSYSGSGSYNLYLAHP